jgi:hypothetical protein
MNDDRQAQQPTHTFCFSGFLNRYWAFFILPVMTVGMGVLLLYLGAARSSTAETVGGIVVCCLAPVWLIPMFVFVSRRPRQVQVTQEGLAWRDRQGEHRCRWEEISEVYRMHKVLDRTATEKKLVWVLANGTRVTTDQTLSDFDRLADAVQAGTHDHLLAGKRSALDGSGAAFGSVVLGRTGITIAGKRFAWDEIDHSTIFNGTLYFFPKSYKGNKSEDAKLTETPNALVMLQLLDEVGKSPVPVEQSVLYTGRKQSQHG